MDACRSDNHSIRWVLMKHTRERIGLQGDLPGYGYESQIEFGRGSVNPLGKWH